jgi:[ribosomal protein S5]-alanine N-acetyltransferase
MTTLRTERLLLRPLEPADAADYAAMRYHPDVAKWLIAPPGEPVASAKASIERFANAWRERGYAPWGLFLDDRLIGHGGLNYVPEFEATEVLWALHPESWGKGYATETARAALCFGFSKLGLPAIFAMTMPDNHPSQAVMRRLGLRYRRNVIYKGVEALWLDIDRASWLG